MAKIAKQRGIIMRLTLYLAEPVLSNSDRRHSVTLDTRLTFRFAKGFVQRHLHKKECAFLSGKGGKKSFSERLQNAFAQGGNDLAQLRVRRAIRRHEDDDIADGPR